MKLRRKKNIVKHINFKKNYEDKRRKKKTYTSMEEKRIEEKRREEKRRERNRY